MPEGYDYSYAEYARRGFFEITVTAGVNTAVMFAVIVLSRKKDGQVPAVLKALGLFICCFTLVLVVTAVSKMVMYINVYGMTLLRIETGAFMLFICAVFIAITARLFTQRVRVLKFAVAAAACTLIVLGVGNAAAFTARYNYNAYKSGRLESVDVDHMRELGDEGVPFLVKLAQGDDPAVRAHARRELYGAFLEYYSWTWEGDDPEHMERRYVRLTLDFLKTKLCF